jgi:hypothetical protein
LFLVARVIVMLVVFIRERDYPFVAIAGVVLMIILLGYVLGTYMIAELHPLSALLQEGQSRLRCQDACPGRLHDKGRRFGMGSGGEECLQPIALGIDAANGIFSVLLVEAGPGQREQPQDQAGLVQHCTHIRER